MPRSQAFAVDSRVSSWSLFAFQHAPQDFTALLSLPDLSLFGSERVGGGRGQEHRRSHDTQAIYESQGTTSSCYRRRQHRLSGRLYNLVKPLVKSRSC